MPLSGWIIVVLGAYTIGRTAWEERPFAHTGWTGTGISGSGGGLGVAFLRRFGLSGQQPTLLFTTTFTFCVCLLDCVGIYNKRRYFNHIHRYNLQIPPSVHLSSSSGTSYLN